jgi:hypothetical protein
VRTGVGRKIPAYIREPEMVLKAAEKGALLLEGTINQVP